MYEIRLSPQAERYFRKIKEKPLKQAFQDALKSISADPYSGSEKVGDLSGIYGWDVYYARTNYEIAYRIYEENGKLVVVILAGTRENFYKELKRHLG